jgi:hypothetical protein
MDFANHAAEVLHAKVQSRSFAEHAVVELGLLLFSVFGGVADRVAVLLLCVAAPHRVDGRLAG